jgi:hypothetical protein
MMLNFFILNNSGELAVALEFSSKYCFFPGVLFTLIMINHFIEN